MLGVREWWRELADLVLPADCAGCGLPRAALCARCEALLRGAGARRVGPLAGPGVLPPVYACLPYADEARAVLLAHKERGALRLAAPLGAALAGAVRAVAARGHDPVRRIALAAAGRLRRGGCAARVLPVLRQGRPVADQAGLDARGRWENLAGALDAAAGAGRLLGEGPVVVVDDLVTTGATLAEAVRALGRCGGRVAGAAVVAVAEAGAT